MKKLLLLSAAMVASGLCGAQEMGRVISATPMVEQVGVPRQVCFTEQIAVQQPKIGAGAVMGAVAGGAMGNAVGGGTQTFYESRAVAYNVVYEYAGKQYSVQMPNDPGPTIRLQVSPAGASAQTAPPAYATPAPQPMYAQPYNVIVAAPTVIYPGYYVQPYYPPVAVQLGFGYWGGYRSHHHWR